ncbi:hypothetical protein Pyn_04190 [Prunus yedoensis var. nudiflora]|uniref:Uncharacterized protein n=1 Tax=Prunus yedoensis var. nudiflora TaxID=2094558 RepID=A0A314ZTT7_PRUYE|nr:hypothetical protein Pyn_04190 [Prunus yedoensis var. nudiflora]
MAREREHISTNMNMQPHCLVKNEMEGKASLWGRLYLALYNVWTGCIGRIPLQKKIQLRLLGP